MLRKFDRFLSILQCKQKAVFALSSPAICKFLAPADKTKTLDLDLAIASEMGRKGHDCETKMLVCEELRDQGGADSLAPLWIPHQLKGIQSDTKPM